MCGGIFGYWTHRFRCGHSGVGIDANLGRCIILIGCGNWMWYMDVVIGCGGFSGIWKEKSASRKVRWQQLERQGGRKDGSVWSFPACLCKTFCILLL